MRKEDLKNELFEKLEAKGEKLYTNYHSWDGKIEPFIEFKSLSENDKYPWIMAASGKKKNNKLPNMHAR